MRFYNAVKEQFIKDFDNFKKFNLKGEIQKASFCEKIDDLTGQAIIFTD
jgi:hypothetical protein